MTDIEAALQRIEKDFQLGLIRPTKAELSSLIDCAKALMVHMDAYDGHAEWCGQFYEDVRECTCGADALKKLGELNG